VEEKECDLCRVTVDIACDLFRGEYCDLKAQYYDARLPADALVKELSKRLAIEQLAKLKIEVEHRMATLPSRPISSHALDAAADRWKHNYAASYAKKGG